MADRSFIAFAKTHWLGLSVFAVAAIACLWFAGSFVADLIYFNDPRHQDVALRPWMTPRYVVMSYDLPRPLVAEVLELPRDGGPRERMDDIAARLDLSLEELTDRVRNAADIYRAGGS